MADGNFGHSKGPSSGKYGENIAMSSEEDKMYTTGLAVDMWYNEMDDPGYDFT